MNKGRDERLAGWLEEELVGGFKGTVGKGSGLGGSRSLASLHENWAAGCGHTEPGPAAANFMDFDSAQPTRRWRRRIRNGCLASSVGLLPPASFTRFSGSVYLAGVLICVL